MSLACGCSDVACHWHVGAVTWDIGSYRAGAQPKSKGYFPAASFLLGRICHISKLRRLLVLPLCVCNLTTTLATCAFPFGPTRPRIPTVRSSKGLAKLKFGLHNVRIIVHKLAPLQTQRVFDICSQFSPLVSDPINYFPALVMQFLSMLQMGLQRL